MADSVDKDSKESTGMLNHWKLLSRCGLSNSKRLALFIDWRINMQLQHNKLGSFQ